MRFVGQKLQAIFVGLLPTVQSYDKKSEKTKTA